MKIILSLIIVLINATCFSQGQKPLKIGDKVPTALWKRIPKKANTKLIILDFWDSYCGACISAFSKMDKLQQQFKDELQIVFMNPREDERKLKHRFLSINAKRVKGQSLSVPKSIPAINGQIIFKKLFPYDFVPQHIWLNAEGKVLAIADGYNATQEHIRTAIDEGKINLPLKDDTKTNELKSLILNSNLIQPALVDLSPIYYSAFMRLKGLSGVGAAFKIDSAKGIFKFSKCSDVISLIKIAFRSENKKERVIINTANKRIIYPNNNSGLDEWMSEYSFDYEQQGLIKDKNEWQTNMQQDVNRFFGSLYGLQAKIEQRKYLAWVLVKVDEELLKSSSLLKSSGYDYVGWTPDNIGYKKR